MKKTDKGFEETIRASLKGTKVPILVLDNRWHSLFPIGEKPAEVLNLEEKINQLLKRQGHLVNEIKDLKKAKKKLMNGVLAGMGQSSARANKKKENQQRLILETNERIEEESEELMGLPSEIKKLNEELLVVGAKYCFERLSGVDQLLEELDDDIKELKEELDEKTRRKAELEESMGSAYSLMHGVFGHNVMNLFDKGKLK
jgi:DNA repair exonuclease SbcCD ATPase subunit